MSNTSLKHIIEGFIFASDKAVSADRIISLFPEEEQPEKEAVTAALEELQQDYEERGIELNKVSTGYRFQVRKELTPWVSRLWEEKPARYTRALLETLALIVYRQPITRGEIEDIRGVAVSSNIIKTLQEREWVRVVGHRDVPGRPALYATTKEFLDYFNLESLEQLPPLSEIKDLDSIAKELDPEKNAELIEAINEMKEEEAEQAEGEQNEATEESATEEDEGEDVEDIIRKAAELAASVADSTDQFIEDSEAAISGKPLKREEDEDAETIETEESSEATETEANEVSEANESAESEQEVIEAAAETEEKNTTQASEDSYQEDDTSIEDEETETN